MTKKLKKDPNRFTRKTPPGVLGKQLAAKSKQTPASLCSQLEDGLNRLIREACAKKEFTQSTGNCSGGGGKTAPVDLVIVIDTSGSMSDEAAGLSAAADAAVQAAASSCPSDLRVAWFGIEGTWTAQDPATKFTQSYRDYLNALGVPNGDIVGTPNDFEDGAAAVIDLSDHFDWRPGASRAIFYLGDEALEGGDPQNADDVNAATSAIAAANNKGVTVFTYYGTGAGDATTVAEYARLANNTGGQAFTAPIGNLGGFQTLLEQIICASGGEGCREAELPAIVPCVKLRWGDGKQDQIETDDTEVLCITVCNPYSNITLKDFTLSLVIVDENNNQVATLPDGRPSVEIKPEYLICFGDIPPCDPKTPDKPSCVSRETVLMTCGAKAGKYRIYIAVCFETCFTSFILDEAFKIELVKS